MTEVVVSVRDLSKRFKLYANPWHRVLEWLTLGRALRHEEFWALTGVGFDVARGECLGIVGVNGAGKSTLLKILSRALHPTSGSFEVRGRLVSLLELGTGFNPELTGRQNIFQSARLLGFPADYVRERLPAILDFAQVGEFIDQPVKQYSSGMFVRLAFSLFAHFDPDVYIVDETLAVGDVFFQQKCFERFRELRSRGCTILFVSHDMEAITHLCDRAILLSGGKLVAQGNAATVVHDYFALMGQTFAPGTPAPFSVTAGAVAGTGGLTDVPADVRHKLAEGLPPEAHAATGTRGSEIVGFAVADQKGRLAWDVASGEALQFWYLVEAKSAVPDLNVGIHFYDRRGILVYAVGSINAGITLPPLQAGDRILCAVTVTMAVQPGAYTVLAQTGGLTNGHPEPGLLHDRLESLPPVIVTGWRGRWAPFYGLARLPTDIAWATTF
jgi:ABC-type polysaccharide/polyol phosphate transport system ATPase subunit